MVHPNWYIRMMNKEQRELHVHKLQSLHKSIQHWDKILSYIVENDKGGLLQEGWNGASCQCCTDFYDSHDSDNPCRNCPICEYSGNFDCYGTPWGNAHHAITAWTGTDTKFYSGNERESRRTTADHYTREELKFLNQVYEDLVDKSDALS